MIHYPAPTLAVGAHHAILERGLMKIAGIILIVLGILALVYQNFSYTDTKQVAKLGSIEIQNHETHDIPVPPVVGAVCIVAGVVVLIIGGRGKL
jgi:uncharacterized membrane protein HdeD (DUF308 family)